MNVGEVFQRHSGVGHEDEPYRVWGFRGLGFRARVQGLGFRALGLGFRG